MSDSNVPATPAVSPARRRRLLRITAAFLVIGGIFAAGSAFADRHWRHGPEADRDRVSFMLEHLNDRIDGTDEQLVAFEKIVDQHFAAATVLRKEGRELKMKLAETLLADKVDARQVEVLRKQLVSMVDRASVTASQAAQQAASVLTPVQKQEILERLADRFAR